MRDTGIKATFEAQGHRRLGAALILLAAAVAATPIWLHRTSCGDDLQFHLLSFFDASQSWRHGTLYPHWAPSANYGAGEPRFLFYPPLTWMLGAALGLALPWTWVPTALLFLLFTGAGLSMRALARRLLPPTNATLAGLAAILCLYPLFSAYDRGAFGELAGAVWIPLLLLFALEDTPPRSGLLHPSTLNRSTLWLVLAVAACWLSDAPVGVMATYLLAAVAIALALLARSWAPLLRAAIGASLGLGVAAFYILPAAWEQRWVNVRKASGMGDPGLAIEQNWLFGHSADPALQAHQAGLHYVSWIAVAMITLTTAVMLIVWFLRPHASTHLRRIWIVLALIPPAVLFLQLPASLPLWNLLPKLRFLQFPWRWLLVLETPLALSLAAAAWPQPPVRRAHRIAGSLLFSSVLLASFLYIDLTAFRQTCAPDELPSHILASLRSGAGSWGADEYEPIGTDITLIPSGLPDACLTADPTADLATDLATPSAPDTTPAWNPRQSTCLASATASLRTQDHLHLTLLSPAAGYAVLRLQRYPAWRVQVNGQPVRNLPQREDGLLTVPVPAGTAEITVDWTTTPDVLIGRAVSLLSTAILILLWQHLRRNRLPAPA